jgi:hypothetical protein
MKYSPASAVRAVREPRFAARELNRLIHTRMGRYEFNPRGVDIFAEDWDNLIILDACRYDEFARLTAAPNGLESKYSQASMTEHFVRANFSGRTLHDTVYVSANSWYLKLRDEIDSELHRFLNIQSGQFDVEWADEELRVATPASVTNLASEAEQEHPDKRLIVHYLQPHHPFVGPTGVEHFSHQSNSLQAVVAASGSSDRLLREAYRENLEIVLREAWSLVSDLAGKTVVTSDHGEMLGDRHEFIPVRDYGHHRGIFNEPTSRIPWQVHESEDRKSITSDPPTEDVSVDIDQINEQLRHLGYNL